MKKLTFGILRAAAVATAVLIARRACEGKLLKPGAAQAGEIVPSTISLERVREAGI